MILDETLRGKAEGLYAFGRTKLFMKNALLTVLEKARDKAVKKKGASVNTIKQAFLLMRA